MKHNFPQQAVNSVFLNKLYHKQPEAQSDLESWAMSFDHGNIGFMWGPSQTPHSRQTSTYVTTYIFSTIRHASLLKHVWNSFASLLWSKDASNIPPPHICLLKSWCIVWFVSLSDAGLCVAAHKCPICEKCFAMKSSLKIHLLTHTKVR
jgi:hypothetical protein